MKYTFSDEEDGSDEMSSRRSARNSGISTPLESGPTVTASGRQVKSRVGGMYGESILVDQRKELEKGTGDGHFTETSEDMPTTAPNGRASRVSRAGRPVRPARERFEDGRGSDSDEAQSSGKEWSGNEDELDESEPEFDVEDEEEDEVMSDEGLKAEDVVDDDNTQESLVVQLRYRKGKEPVPPAEKPPSMQSSDGNGFNGSAYTPSTTKLPSVPAAYPISDTIDVTRRVNGMNGDSGPLTGNTPPQEANSDQSQNGVTASQPQRVVSVQMPLQPMDVS